jgi:hypothetical protein
MYQTYRQASSFSFSGRIDPKPKITPSPLDYKVDIKAIKPKGPSYGMGYGQKISPKAIGAAPGPGAYNLSRGIGKRYS